MKLKRDEIVIPGLVCGGLEDCLEKGFNCCDCPHIPDNKRIFNPYSGERIKK